MTPSTVVFAILLSISPFPSTGDSTYVVAEPPVEMTLEECESTAKEINDNQDLPFIMVCGTIPESGSAI